MARSLFLLVIAFGFFASAQVTKVSGQNCVASRGGRWAYNFTFGTEVLGHFETLYECMDAVNVINTHDGIGCVQNNGFSTRLIDFHNNKRIMEYFIDIPTCMNGALYQLDRPMYCVQRNINDYRLMTRQGDERGRFTTYFACSDRRNRLAPPATVRPAARTGAAGQ